MHLVRRFRNGVLALALTGGLVLVPSLERASAASIWTEIASGTTHTITAIEYQAADRFWYVTDSGEIFK
ncbi:MAG: hypothetical protein QOH90_834, partial [Actinomycetota bacterium]|nr:hypothetical protein [Actinomycetota bacterium]